jgi:MFS transporter, DHA1 family, tetracycline resistance protein
MPGMLVDSFGKSTYALVGIVETIKGLLAFIACPLFGKISDKIGRKYCLLASVIGTTFPLIVMVFTKNMWIYAGLHSDLSICHSFP